MKQTMLFAILMAVLFSCNSSADKLPDPNRATVKPDENATTGNSEENLALVHKFIMAVENDDTATMASVLADNYRGYGPSIGDSASKEEALENWKYNIENFYSSVKYTRFHNMAVTVKEGAEAEAGEWVSNWAYCTITYKDGRGPVTFWMNAVYKIEGGKIVKSRTFYNEADVLRQLGYKITKPKS